MLCCDAPKKSYIVWELRLKVVYKQNTCTFSTYWDTLKKKKKHKKEVFEYDLMRSKNWCWSDCPSHTQVPLAL